MKKKLIISMLLLGSFSVKAMEDFGCNLDRTKQQGNFKRRTLRKIKHKPHATKIEEQIDEEVPRSSILGFVQGRYNFGVTVKSINNNILVSNIKVQIDLSNEEFLKRFLEEGLTRDPRNSRGARKKQILAVIRMVASPCDKIENLFFRKLYTRESILPWMEIHAQIEEIVKEAGRPFGNKRKKAKKRYKLTRRASTSILLSDKQHARLLKKLDKET